MLGAIDPGSELAQAAESLVGTRFRLHGRDPATGLDCLGVLAAAMSLIGRRIALPVGYTLRTCAPRDLAAIAAGGGLATLLAPSLPGDVAFVRIAATQFHLLIATGRATGGHRFVHAHAGLRRVVAHEGALAWPLVAAWRLQDIVED